jgi:serine/threonine protein phosphatase PrpC
MEMYAYECIIRNILTPEQIYNQIKNKFINYIIDCFKSADIDMTKQSSFDYYSSGTTCNLVIQLNKNLICANVGNSRGIIIYDTNGHTNRGIYQISTDHIPELPQEKQRIYNKGGMVDRFTDKSGRKYGHYRIYKKGQATPGIHISRALGDFDAKGCGVINVPDIKEYHLNNNSKYMVICSDGIWEVLTNEYVRDLGNIYYKKGQVDHFCYDLVQIAMNNWKSQFPNYMDDIAVVCVYF